MKSSKRNHLILFFSIAIVLFSGCSSLPEKTSTVTVEGIGSVKGTPDTVSLSVSLNRVAPTTKEAREQVDAMASRVLSILGDSKIERRNIRTASLIFRPEYDWKDGQQHLLGQRAEQTIVFSMEGINTDKNSLSYLLDKLTEVDGMIMQQMYFDISDKASMFSQSRELAFQKAMDKAMEYAALSKLSIDSVISISENQSSFPGPLLANRLMGDPRGLGSGSSPELPTGELEITTQITVVFRMK